jgi:hypothetical protein
MPGRAGRLLTPGAIAVVDPPAGYDLVEAIQERQTRIILAAAQLDYNPSNNRQRNLKSLCQRCHMIHDRSHHLMHRRITYLLRRALGDLLLGPYDRAWQRLFAIESVELSVRI